MSKVLKIENASTEFLACFFINANKPRELHIRESLLGQLPPYLIPSVVIELTEFPLMANGKVDVQQLNKLAFDYEKIENSPHTKLKPQNEIEELVHQVWSELLDIKEIGTNEHFLDLGGHSLLAIKVSNRLKNEIKLDISMNKIFEKPTISSLSNYIIKEITRQLN